MTFKLIKVFDLFRLSCLMLAAMLPAACSTMLPDAPDPTHTAAFSALRTSSAAMVTPSPAPGPSPLNELETIAFTEDKSVFANPERGWYRAYSTNDLWDIGKLKAQGITMVLLKANLKDFTSGPISEEKLQEIQNAFDTARKNNLQVIFRAAYDFDGVKKCEPNSLSTILGHIKQLKSIFTRNEDILYCVQAGFLGPWGEWHSSKFGDPPSLQARKSVLFALMEAVPKSKSILVRRPMFIRDIYQDLPGGSALTASTSFSQSNLARTGYHDDALLSTAGECGTYEDPGFSRADELEWVDNQDRYVPFTAESNQLTSYSDPKNAIYELNKLHAQAVDALFHPDVIKKWKSTKYDGVSTYDYISRMLGYRFVFLDAAINKSVRKGGAIRLQFRFKNLGFGNVVNARPVEVVLNNGRDTFVAEVKDDPRQWFRESGAIARDLYFSIPSDISSGKWNIYLNLPGAYESLKHDPSYSIRFANLGVWQEATGYNLIRNDINIEQAYEDNAVDSFRQVSKEEAERLCGT